MARKKEYIEEEVLEKAMELFWRNGYESTSVRMLEKESTPSSNRPNKI